MTSATGAAQLRNQWIYGSIALGILALLASAIGAVHDSKTFFQNYLFSFLFWSDLPLGAIPLLMIYHLTGGKWGTALRSTLEAISNTVPLVALFVIPILFGLRVIYPWLEPAIAADPDVAHKHVYLNTASFCARTIFYFGCWIWLNHGLQHWSPKKQRSLSAGGLVLVGFIASFAAIDWQMSVEPTWYSTIYGMLYGVGQALGAFAFALLAFGIWTSLRRLKYAAQTVLDLSNLLLALVMIWAYLSFMQYLVVWSGNLPHEVIWYQHRSQGGWQWMALLLFLFQFSAPFILLLFRGLKGRPSRLAWIGGLVFVMRGVDHYWMLIPGFKPGHFTLPWFAFTTWLGLGGLWFAYFLTQWREESHV